MTVYTHGHAEAVLRSHRWRTAATGGGARQRLRPLELAEVATAWRAWAADPDGWFSVLHGEVLLRA